MLTMKKIALFLLPHVLTIALIAQHKDAVLLPNGWKLTPAGESFSLGDLPLNMVVSPSSKLIAVTNNGQSTQTIELIDVQKQKKIDSVVVAKSWYGLRFSSNEKYLYASGGHDNLI